MQGKRKEKKEAFNDSLLGFTCKPCLLSPSSWLHFVSPRIPIAKAAKPTPPQPVFFFLFESKRKGQGFMSRQGGCRVGPPASCGRQAQRLKRLLYRAHISEDVDSLNGVRKEKKQRSTEPTAHPGTRCFWVDSSPGPALTCNCLGETKLTPKSKLI